MLFATHAADSRQRFTLVIYNVDCDYGAKQMKAQVSKWGNSLAIRLPKAIAETLQVRQGQAVDLTIEGNSVVMRASRQSYTIEELVAEMAPQVEPEVLDDVSAPPVGQELL